MPLNLKSLNFNDIMVISLTNKIANIIVSANTTQKLFKTMTCSAAMGIKPKKSALAGDGNPMKLVACRSSMLNFAALALSR